MATEGYESSGRAFYKSHTRNVHSGPFYRHIALRPSENQATLCFCRGRTTGEQTLIAWRELE